MTIERELPDDIEALKALVLAQADTIAALAAKVEKLTRQLYGPKSERRPVDAGFVLEPGISWRICWISDLHCKFLTSLK